MNAAHVVHAIDGRLRIRLDGIKSDPLRAERHCDAIRSIPGVETANANPIIGSITITYDCSQVSRRDLYGDLERIVGSQLLPAPRPASLPSSALLVDARNQLVRAVLNTAIEVAVKRAIYGLL